MKKGQGSIEYLLIVAVVLIIVVLIAIFLLDIFSESKEDALFTSCYSAASQCHKNKGLYGDSYSCFKECYKSCVSGETGNDVLLGKETGCPSAYSDNFDGSACGYCREGLFNKIQPTSD